MTPTIGDAIKNLRPEAGFVLRGDSIDGIEWLDGEPQSLTTQEIEIELARLEKAAADEAAAREAAKASALAKLEALGLTADEAQAIAGI
jgi:hypothetical protein